MNFRLLLPLFMVCATGFAQGPRARALGVPFDGTPGPLDAITDVKGVEVGDTTLIRGEGKLVVGQGPVRTGVTVIFPRGRADAEPVYAGWFSQNGNGEMTGTTWVEESGFLEGPVAITNTHSVGLVRDSVIAWSVQSGRLGAAALVPSRGRRNLGWLPERHQRVSRAAIRRVLGAQLRPGRPRS